MNEPLDPDRTLFALATADESAVAEAMEIYMAEVEAGHNPDRREFLARFPEIADSLEIQLKGLDFLNGIAPQAQTAGAGEGNDEQDLISSRGSLGDFRLIRQIGRGGMGVVYEAEQLSLGRRVAVKVLPFAAMLDDQHRKRFQNEARAAATLDHAHIVPIHFVGQERGVHFYAMPLIDGQSMAELIEGLRGGSTNHPSSGRVGRGSGRGGAPRKTLSGPESPTLPKGEYHEDVAHGPRLAPSAYKTPTAPDFRADISTRRSKQPDKFFRTVARLGAEAAEALEHAHQVGILHRDIKPGNLLLDSNGKLWVADFGLATIEHAETLTRTGGVLGTAAYMSPEQASDSHRIDGRSDVYALGATLYELLTLQRHRSDMKTVATTPFHTDNRAVSPHRINADVPIDLETIVIKALAYDPVDRYGSAGAMADDLRAFVDGREIQARRLTFAQRKARWFRHHRRLVTFAIATAFLLMAGFGAVMVFNSRRLATYSHQLESALDSANELRKEAETQSLLARQQTERAEASEQEARASENRARRISYLSEMKRAFQLHYEKDYAMTARVLEAQMPEPGQDDFRGIEWQLLNAKIEAKRSLLGTHSAPATECVAFPDDRRVATAGKDEAVHVWDVLDKKKLKTFRPAIGPIQALAISPDGKTLAVGGAPTLATLGMATIHLLDADTGQRKSMIQRHQTTIESIEFSPDGEWIAAGSRNRGIQLSTVEGKNVKSMPAHARHESLAFSPDSRFLVSKYESEDIQVWDCETGRAAMDLIQLDFVVDKVAWSPDGQYIAVTARTGPWIKLVDAASGKPVVNLLHHSPGQSWYPAISISADSRTVYAGDDDGRIHQWSVDFTKFQESTTANGGKVYQRNRRKTPLSLDRQRLTSIACLTDDRVVAVHDSGKVTMYESDQTADLTLALDFGVATAAVAPDSTIYVAAVDGAVYRVSSDLQTPVRLVESIGSGIEDLDISGDGSLLAVVYGTSQVDLIRTADGSIISTRAGDFPRDPRFRVALSCDGKYLARTGDDKQVIVWEAHQNQDVLFRQPLYGGRSLSFSRDGKLLVVGSNDIHVLDTDTGDVVDHEPGYRVSKVQFSRDCRYVVSGQINGVVSLYDRSSGKSTTMQSRHARAIPNVALSTDSRTIVAYDQTRHDGRFRLWDVASREEIGVMRTRTKVVPDGSPEAVMTFATDQHLIVCTIDGERSKIGVWDLAEN